MPAIVALINKAKVFLKDMLDNILMIYTEKGIEPFKKPLLFAFPTVLILYGAVYGPLSSKLAAEKDALSKKQLIAVNYADYEDAKTKLSAYQRKLPLLKDKDEWLSYLMTSTAKNQGISFDSISPQTENEVGNFLLVSRSVSVTTTYAKFGRWVADIEGSQILLKVADVNMKKDNTRAGVLKINMKLSTIFPKFVGTGGGR